MSTRLQERKRQERDIMALHYLANTLLQRSFRSITILNTLYKEEMLCQIIPVVFRSAPFISENLD